jgi:hypothetical protein
MATQKHTVQSHITVLDADEHTTQGLANNQETLRLLVPCAIVTITRILKAALSIKIY